MDRFGQLNITFQSFNQGSRQLRPILCRDLQRRRDHGLECQLHGTKEPQDHAGQVGGTLWNTQKWKYSLSVIWSGTIIIIFILFFLCRCNSEHECSILADSDNFGGDPCPGVPKYLEVYFGCFPGMLSFVSSFDNFMVYIPYKLYYLKYFLLFEFTI